MDVEQGHGKGPRFGVRHVQILLLCLSLVAASIFRLNISVSVVAMTNASSTNPDFPEYKWNEKQISMILSSFFLGILISVGPGSQINRKIGAKLSMLVSLLGTSFFSILVPVSISYGGWQMFCILRIIQGIFQGIMFSGMYDHLAKWSPIEERSKLGAMSQLGNDIGTILAILLPGLIAKSSLGWPGISYVSAGLGILWCFLWLSFADNTPNSSRFITLKEKQYILESQMNFHNSHQRIPVPWKAILTSRPFLSLALVLVAHTWGYTTILAEIPLYMRGIMKMDIKSNSLFSALPFCVMLLMSNIYIFVAEVVLKKKILTLGTLRKTISIFAMWSPSLVLTVIGFLDKNHKALVIGLIIFAIGMNAGCTIGYILNVIDLSPNHAATLIGITHTLLSGVAFVTPLFAGFVIHDETNRMQWQLVFLTAAIIYFFGNLQYIFFGTTVTQPWNDKDFLLSGETKSREISIQSKLIPQQKEEFK